MPKEKMAYKTNEICAMFDISKATLFRWEEIGLITKVGRDWRNWRLYSARNIREIKEIIDSKPGKKDASLKKNGAFK